MTDSLTMAKDALEMMLGDYEVDGKTIPNPTPINKVEHKPDEFVTYISADTRNYLRRFRSKTVKKILTLPEWLNDEATNAGINYSQTLQNALKRELKYE